MCGMVDLIHNTQRSTVSSSNRLCVRSALRILFASEREGSPGVSNSEKLPTSKLQRPGHSGSALTYEADRRDEGPTAVIMRSYQAPILELCIRSMKVSVHVTLRMTPNTDRSARSGC